MKILFVVTGFGYGDSIRIDSVISEIKKLSPKAKILVIGYSVSYNYFSSKYPCLKMNGYRFPDRDMKFSTSRFMLKNFYLVSRWIKSFMKHKKAILDFNPDIVVSDFEPLGIIIARKLGVKCISIFGFDPETYKTYPHKNMTLNLQAKYISSLYKESDLVIIPSFKKQSRVGNIIYVNPIVRKYSPKNEISIMRKLRLTKKPILVMLGGSNYGISLANKIGKINQKLKQELIIFGGREQLPYLHYVKFKENFLDYLQVCSGIITLAGNLTLSECLTLKKPALVLPIKDHVEQQMNAYSLKDVFLVETKQNSLEKSIRNFIKNKEKLLVKLNKLNVKPNGARQAAEMIIKEVIK
jgi:uncharacterized protein (TIGR00661 family)